MPPISFVNDNTITFEIWDTSGPGTFYKSMENVYTKK